MRFLILCFAATLAAGSATAAPSCEVPADVKVMRARVIELSRSGGKLRLVVDRGSDHGVAVGWKALLVDERSKRVHRLPCADVTAVEHEESTVITAAPEDVCSSLEGCRLVFLTPKATDKP